jgi:hypothetical protein
MERLFSILGGIISVAIAIFMIASYFILKSGSIMNPNLINSTVDKLFFAALMIGAATIYLIFSISLLSKYSFRNIKMKVAFIISGLSFLSGIYYHFIFQSPW